MRASLFARLTTPEAGGPRRRARPPRRALLLLAAGSLVAAGAGTATSFAQGQSSTTPSQTPAFPPCFGAAARDYLHPCNNSSLRLTVKPTPDDAVIEANSACLPVSLKIQPFVCTFGFVPTPGVPITTTVALVGDSHAAHWRAALEPVAQAKHWAGASLTRSSCPFSRSIPVLEEPARSQCLKWNPQVQGWFRRHKAVSVVFISEHIQAAVRTRKSGQFETKVAGYMAQWSALPATVKSIVVIKDAPRATGNTGDCVTRAIHDKRRPGSACAVARSYAVKDDPALEAVRRLNSPRYMAIDMTSFFCSPRLCQPVIGGALVHKDPGHITRVFGETLGPYLLREVNKLPPFASAPAPAAR